MPTKQKILSQILKVKKFLDDEYSVGVQQVLAWEEAVPLDSVGITYTVKREAGVRLIPVIPAQEAEEGGLLLAWGHPGLHSKLQTSLVYRMRTCFFVVVAVCFLKARHSGTCL